MANLNYYFRGWGVHAHTCSRFRDYPWHFMVLHTMGGGWQGEAVTSSNASRVCQVQPSPQNQKCRFCDFPRISTIKYVIKLSLPKNPKTTTKPKKLLL